VRTAHAEETVFQIAFSRRGGSFFLFIALVFGISLQFERKPKGWSVADSSFATVFLVLCASLGVSLLASGVDRPDAQRLARSGFTLATFLLISFLTAVSMRPFFGTHELPPSGTATFAALLASSGIAGLWFYLSERRRIPRRGRHIVASVGTEDVFMWPLLMLLRAPVVMLVYLLIVGGMAFGG